MAALDYTPPAEDQSRIWSSRCEQRDVSGKTPGLTGGPRRRSVPAASVWGWRWSGPARPGWPGAVRSSLGAACCLAG